MISNSIMVRQQRDEGFTVAEIVVTLVVMSIFVSLFFQMYLTQIGQRTAVTLRATADDISLSNLNKITAKSTIPASTAACNGAAGSPNNSVINPAATGSIIATNATSGSPTWATAGLTAEPIAGTPLSGGATQVLKVLYPQGCSPNTLPAEIISTVSYGLETVAHAAYVN